MKNNNTNLIAMMILAAVLLGMTACSSSEPATPTLRPVVTIPPTISPLVDTSLFEAQSYKELLTVAASSDTTKKIAVTGTVVKLIERETTTSLLVSMNEREDQLYYCEFDSNLPISRLSIGDKITTYGTYSHSNTMLLDDCSTVAVPYLTVEYIN